VPALGLGTYKLKGKECYQAVREAMDIGYQHIDTARMYENEAEVGRAIEDSNYIRERLFLTSKIWFDHLGKDAFIQEVEQSLSELRTDYLDLVLIHWPNEEVRLEETLEAMHLLKERGLIRFEGVSNFPPALLEHAADLAHIYCCQVEYHVFLQQHQLRKICQEKNMLLTAYSPLAQGMVPDDSVLEEIGEVHGKTASQVALRWLIQQPNVAAIPKSASSEHRRQNYNIFDFNLTDEEMERIDDLPKDRRQVDPEFAPDWEMAVT